MQDLTIGSTPNTGLGEPLFDAFTKIQANKVETVTRLNAADTAAATADGKAVAAQTAAAAADAKAVIAQTTADNASPLAGSFTTALPTVNIKTNKEYSFAGTDNASIGGFTWVAGDKALHNGTAWTKIAGQNLTNYYTKTQHDASLENYDEKYSNILNPALFVFGYAISYSNGSTFPLADATYSGQQRVIPGRKYTLSTAHTNLATSNYIHFWTAAGVWITNTITNPEYATWSNGNKTVVLTIPANCFFITFCTYTTPLATFTNNHTLTAGEEAFAWAAFKTKLISAFKQNKSEVAALLAPVEARATTLEATAVIQASMINTKVSSDSTVLVNRENLLENSATPAMLVNKTLADAIAQTTMLSIAAVPASGTTFPLKDYGLGFVRTLTSANNTSTNLFIAEAMALRTAANRPARIEMAFWVEDTATKLCFPNAALAVWFFGEVANLSTGRLDNFIDVIGTKTATRNFTSTSTAVSSYKYFWEVLTKNNGWTKIVLRVYDLVWKGAFLATTSPWYLILNGNNANMYQRTFYMANIELLFDTETPSGKFLGYPSADGNKKYPMNIEGDLGTATTKVAALETAKVLQDSRITAIETAVQGTLSEVLYNSDLIYKRSYYSATKDIVVKTNAIGNHSATLIDKADPITATGIIIQNQGDDGAPICLSGIGYIGGNHGLAHCREITSAAHGKTLADIGSLWKDTNNKEYVLLKIVSASVIYALSRNYGTAAVFASATPTAGTNLVHVSGAANTGAIPVTSVTSYQLPSRRDTTTTVKIDGVTVSQSATVRTARKIELTEVYSISDPVSMMDTIVANKPGGGYLTQPDTACGSPIFKVTNRYTLAEDACLFCTAEIEFFMAVALAYWGMTQRGFYNPVKAVGHAFYDAGATNSYTRYIPKALPIPMGDGADTDLRLGRVLDTPWTLETSIPAAKFEIPTSPPDRSYDIIKNTTGFKAATTMTFLPIGVGFPNRHLNVSDAWYLYTSMKNYPRGINDALNVAGAVPIGIYKQGVVLNKWVNLEAEINRTCHYFAEYEGTNYLYVDYHATCLDKIPAAAKLTGKRVTVVEKSANITVLTDVVTDSIRINCTIGTPAYGYAVLKIQ